jgi:serine/threonine-protein kinase SRPK3
VSTEHTPLNRRFAWNANYREALLCSVNPELRPIFRHTYPFTNRYSRLSNNRDYSDATMANDSRAPIYVAKGDVEDLERYCEGGFHPIHIGDQLHGRYQIVNKLGYGSYSTVWLVKDQRLDRYASLKIDTANSSKDTSASQVLRHLGLKREGWSKIPPGNEFVLEVLDEFEIRGPNGTHRCIVSEPLGPSLTSVLEFTDGWRLPSDVSRKVAAQLAQGVAFLHACGIFHGGAFFSYLIKQKPN